MKRHQQQCPQCKGEKVIRGGYLNPVEGWQVTYRPCPICQPHEPMPIA